MSDDKRSRFSKVYRRMWTDARFMALSAPPPNGQTLFQRLLTGPELSNIPGVFMAGEAGLAEALGWSLEGFREAFTEVYRQGLAKADWKARFVFIPKAIRHNKPESPNVVVSWKTAWDELPECALKTEAYRTLKAFVEDMGEGFAKAFAKACPDPSPNQEQEQEQEQKQEQEGVQGAAPTVAEGSAPVTPVLQVQDGAKKPKVGKRGRLPQTFMRDDWEPTAEHAKYVRAKGLDVAAVVEDFRNHWLAEGKPGANWDARFKQNVDRILRTEWLVTKFAAPPAPEPPPAATDYGPAVDPPPDAQAKLASILGRTPSQGRLAGGGSPPKAPAPTAEIGPDPVFIEARRRKARAAVLADIASWESAELHAEAAAKYAKDYGVPYTEDLEVAS